MAISTDDILVLIKNEMSRAEAMYGAANATKRPEEWVALVAKRLGHLATAAASGNQSWLAEELVKIAATAIEASLSVPSMAFSSLGSEGLAVLADVDTPYPRIVTKVSEPVSGSTLVARDVRGVVVGGGMVWVVKDPE